MAEVVSTGKQTDIEQSTLQSSTRVIRRALSDSGIITNILSKGVSDTKTTYKNLRKQTTAVQLRTLARISGQVSKALNIYQGFSNSGWTIQAETDRAERALEAWFDEMADVGININVLINENIYDLYILGAMCMRTLLINDEPKLIRNIPPEEVEFIHQVDPDPDNADYGKVWYKGFYLQPGGTEFVVLESILDPNPYFFYGAMLSNSKSPKGLSIIESVIQLAISAGEKDYMMTEYLRGAIFPSEIISLILKDYFDVLADENIEWDMEKFNEVKEAAVKAVEKFIEEGDATQTLVSDVPMEKLVQGTLEGNNLRGLSDINDSHSEEFPRALKAPSVLMGGRKQGNALNDTESKYEIRSFYKNVLNIRETVREGWEKLCTSYLTYRGLTGKGGIAFTDTDVELMQSITEAVKSEAEAGKVLVDTGIFLRSEIRKALVSGILDLTQFSPEMPTELSDEPVANSQPEPEGDDEPTDTPT